VRDLCAILEERRPPPTATPQELATKRFWEGREFFVVVDGITEWSQHQSPLAPLVPFVSIAEDVGLHLVTTADIRHYSLHAATNGVLGKVAGQSPAIVIMNGTRAHGQIVPGVFAEPQREGKGRLESRRGSEGVLVGWSEPPQFSRRR
jgi:hypothetical protein